MKASRFFAIVGVVFVLCEGTDIIFRASRSEAAGLVPTSQCSLASLQGTFSFNGQGFVTGAGLPTPLGQALPLGDVGAAYFDGHGHVVGFTDENLDGSLTEVETPFEGTYELHRGPHGEGCTGVWQLQDHHPNPPTDTEGPHQFRIVLARASKGFQYTLMGGGLGPAVLSGFATLDTQ